MQYKTNDLRNLSAIEVYNLRVSGHIKKFPMYFWTSRDSYKKFSEIGKYLFEIILKWDTNDIAQNIKLEVFKENLLGGAVHILFKDSTYKAINNIYPNKFKPWELLKVPNDYWDNKSAIIATKWLLEEKLEMSDEDILNINTRVFLTNNLGGMLQVIYNNSPIKAIMEAYPDRFHICEFKKVPQGYWNHKNTIQAVRYVLEDKYNLESAMIPKLFTVKFCSDNNLNGALALFNWSPIKLLNYVYPDKFNMNDFSNIPSSFWNEETIQIATKYVIEQKCSIQEENILKIVNKKFCIDNGLSGVLKFCNGSVSKLLKITYPSKFNEIRPIDLRTAKFKDAKNLNRALKSLRVNGGKLTYREASMKFNVSLTTLVRWNRNK